jgi:hypothetical protein
MPKVNASKSILSASLIAELDKMAEQSKSLNNRWTEIEIEIVKRYGNKVHRKTLAEMVNKLSLVPRSVNSVDKKRVELCG